MFTKMSDGTKEEWEHISQEHAPHIMDMPTRVIEMLKQLFKHFYNSCWHIHDMRSMFLTNMLPFFLGAI